MLLFPDNVNFGQTQDALALFKPTTSMKHIVSTIIGVLLLFCSFSGVLLAEDMEARRWTHLPTGTNIFGVAAVHTTGEIFFDPVLRIEEGEVEANTVVTSYLHAFDLFGKSARIDVRLPYQRVRWEGVLDGEFRSVQREGLGDPFLRLSLNFVGAPALKGEEYRAYRASHTTNTIVGAALGIVLPLGQYKEDNLLNLGQNRYIIRPQMGFVHTHGPWSYELTGSINFYTDNNEFWDGNKRQQDPLYLLQTHLIYTFRNSIWTSFSAGYDWGGSSTVNGVEKDDDRQDLLFAFSAGFPVNRKSNVKFGYIGGRAQEDIGSDTDNFVLSYSMSF